MATDVERLIVRLEVSQARFERQMANMSNVADRRARQVESRFAAMNRNVQSQFDRLGTRLGAAVAGAFTIQSATRFLDSSVRIQNALRVSGLEGEALTKVYDALFESAQKNGAPFEALVTLYSRTALVQRELGVTTQELTGFTNTVAMALRAGGTSAQEASGALLQLSQALGGGTVRAEEFNSINEGAPTILQAAAAGIREAGGSVATLRQLMIDGQLSSQAFFRGIEAGAPLIERRLDGATSTVSSSLQRLDNAFTDLAKRFNESSEATSAFSSAVNTMVASLNTVDVSHIVAEIERIVAVAQSAKTAIDFLTSTLPSLGARIGAATGLDNVGRLVDQIPGASALGITSTANERDEQAAIQNRFDALVDQTNAGFDAFAEAWRSRQAEAAAVQNVPAPTARPASGQDLSTAGITPISLADHPVSGGTSSKGGSGGSGGGRGRRSGGGGGGRGAESAFQREIEQIRERTAAIQAEAAAMGALNPTIDDYGFALEKTRAEQDLLNAAKKAGIAVTPQLQEQISTLATGYASASVEANKLADSQDEIRKRADEMQALGKEVMGGLISDLRSGTNAADALSNALGKIADKLIDDILNSMVKVNGAGGGRGFLSSVFGLFGRGGGISAGARSAILARPGGGLYDRGGYTGAGRRLDPAGIVHKGEVVWNQDDVRRVGGPAAAEAIRLGRLPGYAKGGVVGLPTPAGRPSTTMTPFNIRVVNNTGVQADARTEKQNDGSLAIILDKAVADNLQRRGTESNLALRQGFGARPRLKGR